MAILLPPVTVPSSTKYPENRSAELHITAPVVGIPQIKIINQYVERDADGNPTMVGPVEYDRPYTIDMMQFLAMCPDLADIPGRITDAMDSLKERMPDRRFVPPQPVITGISATTGPAAGGNTIHFNGTEFGYPLMVIFGTAPPVLASVPNTTSASVVVPPGTQGDCVDVTVILGPNHATLSAIYTYT